MDRSPERRARRGADVSPWRRLRDRLALTGRDIAGSCGSWDRTQAGPERREEQTQGRRRAEFAPDSALEEAVSSEPVSAANSLVTGKNTGNFIETGVGSRRSTGKWT